MKIVVTGATGYIGQYFVRQSLSLGHEIVTLGRRRHISPFCGWIFFDLSSDQLLVLPNDTDVVLHLATSTNGSSPEESSDREIRAADLLIISAQNANAKFIFISSQTARVDAPSIYGRTKWLIEQRVLDSGGVVVRPGQVYGGVPSGLFGKLIEIVKRLPILPEFLPAPKIQPIHVDDLVFGLLQLAGRPKFIPRVILLGSEKPVTFTEFLQSIARDRLRLTRFFIPVPQAFISICIKFFGKQGSLERLASLFDLHMMDSAYDIKELDLSLRTLTSGMHRSGNNSRRKLLLEGHALLSYAINFKPENSVLRRYVRAIEELREGKTLALPIFFSYFPSFLALIDCDGKLKTSWQAEISWRFDAAATLAEASIFGSKKFLGIGDENSFIRSFFQISYTVIAEIIWRVFALIFAPLIRYILPRAIGES